MQWVSLLWPDAPEEVMGDYEPMVYKELAEKMVLHIRWRFDKDGVDAALSSAVDYLACNIIDDVDLTRFHPVVFDDAESVDLAESTKFKQFLDCSDGSGSAAGSNGSRWSAPKFVASQGRIMADNNVGN
jgi:hypothetical protein